ncbi:YchJ family protein [Saccharobesus litoralis]|uniref:YchJ family protein n=1 Tax=Saccharobesus litoralis TaxID=2172099 RepID=UPI00131EE236|nr:YchJ family protein [Saccharobesus litoralis]
MSLSKNMKCPCHSGESYQACCQPFHDNDCHAPTPEKLMRSRYCAYALNKCQYIVDTLVAEQRQNNELSQIEEFAQSVSFKNLTILDTHQSELTQQFGFVTFKVVYQTPDKAFHWMQEKSRFQYTNEQWFYVDGLVTSNNKPIFLGRNESCLCGSTKKFKRCCG